MLSTKGSFFTAFHVQHTQILLCECKRLFVCLCGTAVKSLIEEMKYALTLLERDESACLHGLDRRKHIGSGQMEG